MRKWTLILALLGVACSEDTTVEPEPPRPAEIAVTPESGELTLLGTNIHLSAEVTDQYGDEVDTVTVTWWSTDTMVATVEASGLVYAWSTGNAEIVAAAGAIADTAVVTVNLVQKDALMEFYEALDGPNWTNSDSWGEPVELGKWYGVTTNDAGNVTSIILQFNNLTGEIPAAALLNLEHLRSLDLSFSFGITGKIPPELGDMRRLASIFLHHNHLTGTIPEALSKLDLDSLNLHDNDLSGEIPAWIGNETNLDLFVIWGNEFTGGIPESFGNLRNLFNLQVQQNPLSGPLPRSLMSLDDLGWFFWDETDLCSPPDDAFQEWLASIPTHYGEEPCEGA